MNLRITCPLIVLCFIFSTVAVAQNEASLDQELAAAKTRLNLTDRQAKDLRPLLERRLNVLRKVTKPPANQALWRELLESRQEFEAGMQRILTPEQKQLLPELHAELENEALAHLRAQVNRAIADRLKPDAHQLAQAQSTLDRDFEQKVELLRNFRRDHTHDAASFTRALEIINDDTEQRLEPILNDKQMAEFRRYSGRSKEQLPWLWGAIQNTSSGSLATQSKSKKRGEFVLAPIPIINPTLGNGLAVGAGYLYHLDNDDRTSPPSITGAGGFRTSNGSRGIVLAQKFVLKRNKYRLLLVAGRADIHFDFFGIGAESGDAGVSIPISVNGRGLLVDGSMRFYGKHWFVGLRYYAMRSTVNVDRSAITDGDGRFPGRPEIPEIDIKLTTAGLGPTLEYDSRSDPFYPRAGSQFRFQASFHGRAVGGRRTYETYNTFYNRYITVSPKHVLAVHASGCQAAGSVPFYDLCFFGQSKDVRGYEVGRYIDRVMIAGQAEYRMELKGRLGAAAFFGAGEVARKWSNLRMDAMKPGGGVGLRFRLTKESHINLRVDYGWGIGGSRGLYLGVTEAF